MKYIPLPQKIFSTEKVSNCGIKILLIISSLCTLCTVVWLLKFCRYGFDFTDESFYLVWISNPFVYSISVTQFGYIYHPLFKLLEENIVALRQANILITFGLGWFFSNSFLKIVFDAQALKTLERLGISAAFATTTLVSMQAGVLTPSYNHLTFQAFIIALIGLLLINTNRSLLNKSGWFAIGIGGWLAFMAKPTSASALAVIILIYLLIAGKLHIRLLLISITTTLSLFIFSAIVIDGSIIGFIERLKDGYEATKILQAGHATLTIFRWDDYNFIPIEKSYLIYGTITLSITVYLLQHRIPALFYFGWILSTTFALLTLAIIFNFILHLQDTWVFQKVLIWKFQELLIWIIPFATLLAGVANIRWNCLSQIRLNHLALPAFLLVLPHAYAFGTMNNYWDTGSVTAIFWVFSGLALLRSISPISNFSAFLLPLALAAQLISVVLIADGLQTPYRQPQPMNDNNFVLDIGEADSTLILSKGFGRYLSEAMISAQRAGFRDGTPMIDLTGQSPGVLYAIGATNIGQAWTIGGYNGSDALAIHMLEKNSCTELATAWLLDEPDGPRRISPNVLLSFGANLNSDFTIVTTFKTAKHAGGFQVPRIQQILKPIRPVNSAVTSCEIARLQTS